MSHAEVANNIPTSQPLVSIGLPVYNGGEYLEHALRTLTNQDYENLEIVISDNASTDNTESICQQFAKDDSRIRYFRNPENIGPTGNFYRVLELATGACFMWAAHDDWWDHNYVSTLVSELDEHRDAVIATSLTKHMNLDGSTSRHKDDRPAPGIDSLANLKVFLKDHACSWIYGLYHTDWLKAHVSELDEYNHYGGDMLWLIDIMLRFQVVGTDQTRIYKRVGKSYCTPTSESEKLRAWWTIFRKMTWLSRNRLDTFSARWKATSLCWRYCYRKYVRRGNPIKQIQRFGQIAAAGWTLFRENPGQKETPPPASDVGNSADRRAA